MTSPTASEMGKRRQAQERKRLGAVAYRKQQGEYGKMGGAAGKGKKKRKRPTV